MPHLSVATPYHPAKDLSASSRLAAILLIDDDDSVRSVVARTLRNLGHSVVEAASGEDALAIIASGSGSFDLVICDTFLGGMNGDETARHIAAIEPALPLITMSGYPRDVSANRPGTPPRFFIAKPFRVRALSTLVQEAIACA